MHQFRQVRRTDGSVFHQKPENGGVPVKVAEFELRHAAKAEVRVILLGDDLPQKIVQLILIPDIIFFHDLRVGLHKFQRGQFNILIRVQLQSFQQLFVIPPVHVVVPELLVLLPEQEAGLGQAVFPASVDCRSVVHILVIGHLFLLQKFIVPLDEFIKGDVLSAEFLRHDLFQVCALFVHPFAVDVQSVSVEIGLDFQPEADAQARIVQRRLELLAAPLHAIELQVIPHSGGHAQPVASLLFVKIVVFVEAAVVVFIKQIHSGLRAVYGADLCGSLLDDLPHTLSGHSVLLGNRL